MSSSRNLAIAELRDQAEYIERWAHIDRGNIVPDELDAERYDLDLEGWEPAYIGRDEFYARLADARLLRLRASDLSAETNREIK